MRQSPPVDPLFASAPRQRARRRSPARASEPGSTDRSRRTRRRPAGLPARVPRRVSARRGSTVSDRRSRLLMPINRALVERARSSSRSPCASTSGSRPRSSASCTSARSAAARCRTASRSTASAPKDRRLAKLPTIDHELLGQNRHAHRRADLSAGRRANRRTSAARTAPRWRRLRRLRKHGRVPRCRRRSRSSRPKASGA